MIRDNLFNGILINSTWTIVFTASKTTTLESVIIVNDGDSGVLLDLDIKESASSPSDKSTTILTYHPLSPYTCMVIAQLVGFTIKPGWVIQAKTNVDKIVSIRGSGILS